MKSWRVRGVALVALVALVSGGGWLWTRRGAAPADAAQSAVALRAAEPLAQPSEPAAPATPVPSVQARPARERSAVRQEQRARADAVRAQLRQQLAGLIRHTRGALAAEHRSVSRAAAPPAAAAGEAPAPRMPAPEGEGNQAQRPLGKYIQETMQQQFVPLAGSCYEQLLERDPRARGKLVLDLEVVGDQSTGGVVNDVALGEGTTFQDEEFATCVSESLYSTVFDAPPDDEKSVTISYPIELEP